MNMQIIGKEDKKMKKKTMRCLIESLFSVLLVTTAGTSINAEEAATDSSETETGEVFSQIAEEGTMNAGTQATTSSGLVYEISGGGVTITGYTGSSTIVNIPETINGYTVLKIGKEAFKDSSITSVTIPSKVTNIGDSAFANCTSLKDLTINAVDCLDGPSDSKNNWYDYVAVFHNSGSDAGFKVTFGNGVTRIPAYLFANGHDESNNTFCKISELVIPDTVTEIGDYAFGRCYRLSSVKMGNGVKKIGKHAFEYCTRLKTLTFSSNLTTIQEGAFMGSGLTSLTLPAKLLTIEKEAFSQCASLSKAVIPAKVATIGNSAFASCTSLADMTINAAELIDAPSDSKNNWYDYVAVFHNSGSDAGFKVTFGNGVTRIPAYLFANGHDESNNTFCKISELVIPDTVTEIGDYAFGRCYRLSSVKMGNGVKKIGKHAFEYCTRLKTLTFSSNLTTIQEGAFMGSGLTSLTLPAKLLTIEKEAFSQCASLSKAVIPAKVTTIGPSAFAKCTSLEEMTINAVNLLDAPKDSRNSAYDYMSVFYSSGSDAGFKVTFGSGVTRIPAYLFATGHKEGDGVFCRISEVVIPYSVKEIGDAAFLNCFKLKKVTYAGTKNAWSKVAVGEDNDPLNNAKFTYGNQEPAADPVTKVPMYRLYNPNSGEHFYTAKAKEKDALVKIGWKYEGIGWTAPSTSKTPVYRLYNANAGDHHYTMKKAERDALIKAGWKDEKIGWYSDDSKGVPLYRQYNPYAVSGSHNYTTNKKENDALVKIGWIAEGIGWYGMK